MTCLESMEPPHVQKINYDMVVLRKRLVELKRRAGLLWSETLQHQLRLTQSSEDQRILGHSSLQDLSILEKYMDLMNKRLEVQQKVSLSGLSEVTVEVKRVVGLSDEPEPLPSPKHHRVKDDISETDSDTEKGVFKLYQAEGTIGDVAYATSYLMKSKVGEEEGRVAELNDLNLGTQSAVVKKMLTPVTLGLPETAYHFSADLYYYKILHDERGEALDHLESEVPDVEVVRDMEPIVVQLQSSGQHQVKLQWNIIWCDLNSRFKYNISVTCSEEVVARYSRADVYPYLSKKKKLQTVDDVISFGEDFTNL